MGKLGKKARKFAKKNLQSVYRRQRKTKALFKKRSSSKGEKDNAETQTMNPVEVSIGRSTDGEHTWQTSLDAIFADDDSDVAADASDSDGFLSEDSSTPLVAESDSDKYLEGASYFGSLRSSIIFFLAYSFLPPSLRTDSSGFSTVSTQNKEVQDELAVQKKTLDRLKKKDPEFCKFLKSYSKSVEKSRNEMYSDEDETSNNIAVDLLVQDAAAVNRGKVLTSSIIDSWCKLVTEEHSEPALISLLNAYRAACRYGSESTGLPDTASPRGIPDSETFCNILMLVLHEADTMFRSLLKIPSSNCKKETILELKSTSKWKIFKPLVKSYLRSTLYLLNQVTNSEILAFTLNQLRASIIFFAAFPSLLRRLVKITVHLWAGGGPLSSPSFLIIRDVASVFSSTSFDTCLIKTYKAYISRCEVLEIASIRHIEFLRNSFVELCSLDVEKSCSKAFLSIQQLLKILQHGLRTKAEEAVKKTCCWQYVNCIDLWVMFISANARSYDLHTLLYMTIQLVNGVAYLFPGPRYFPLKVKCIQWLNRLSSASGIFIPVASLVLDLMEYKNGKEGGNSENSFHATSFLKLPKHWLKSQKFQEECVISAIELLSVHFVQWSYHISFPELATIALIRLRKFYETTTIEGLRRMVKRLIDQVEQNVEFVQKKRDEVAFSPKDHQAVDSFLQLEKGSLNSPFTQYYKSVMEKAALRNLQKNEQRCNLPGQFL
ncbi:hypothetical protein RJ639_006183 [Escallonia herrerae]|uniref:Nucleolar complex protein 2 homolog n=1 Tax=Escallonia herrerae TaxID=1293975 RepID=A0AA88VXZ2_9ASTE|nr:hypothetical protein RJ639_006183 [Escallonia herrerae]